MALVAHFDLKLQQMDVKQIFLNRNLDEKIYMKQPKDFEKQGREQLVCKFKRSIYGFKQASWEWYFKFHDTITSLGF